MTPPTVLVTDPIISRFADELTSDGSDGNDWSFAAGWQADRVLAALERSDVVVCSRLSPEQAAACGRARLVQVSGAGYDRIAIDALPRSVAVANTYHHGRSIAEHVLMVAMMLSQHVLRADGELRSGSWRTIANDDAVPFGRTLDGRVLGVIGLGEIGGHAARLGAAMGMRVHAIRNNPDAPPPTGVALDWVGGPDALVELAGTADVLVVTTPLSDATRGMIDATVLGAMASTAVLINVARGPVVDEHALYDALSRRTIAGAGIDVWWDGSGSGTPSQQPYAELDNMVLTPHQSGHTRATFEGRAHDIAANVRAATEGAALRNVVRAAR